MSRVRTRVLIVAWSVVTFAAGAAAGLVVQRQRQGPPRGSWIAGRLNLTDQQREQMRKIWSEFDQAARERLGPGFRALDEERDKAIGALMQGELKAQYEAILQKHARQVAALREQIEALRQEARARTRQILTEDQWKLFQELGPRRGRRDGRFPPGPPPPPREGAAATRPR